MVKCWSYRAARTNAFDGRVVSGGIRLAPHVSTRATIEVYLYFRLKRFLNDGVP